MEINRTKILQLITANWERNYILTSFVIASNTLSESSIFSFPSKGIYLITVTGNL
jgi:hypothetical protein